MKPGGRERQYGPLPTELTSMDQRGIPVRVVAGARGDRRHGAPFEVVAGGQQYTTGTLELDCSALRWDEAATTLDRVSCEKLADFELLCTRAHLRTQTSSATTSNRTTGWKQFTKQHG